jgi:hypothetical protein
MYLVTASVFLAEHGHLNCYQANTKRPEYGMLGHLPLQPKALCVSSMSLTTDNAQNNALERVMK